MELSEFKVLVSKLTNIDKIPPLVIETLFLKLDFNGDSTISLKEFKAKIIPSSKPTHKKLKMLEL